MECRRHVASSCEYKSRSQLNHVFVMFCFVWHQSKVVSYVHQVEPHYLLPALPWNSITEPHYQRFPIGIVSLLTGLRAGTTWTRQSESRIGAPSLPLSSLLLEESGWVEQSSLPELEDWDSCFLEDLNQHGRGHWLSFKVAGKLAI